MNDFSRKHDSTDIMPPLADNFMQRRRSKWDTINSDDGGGTTRDLDPIDAYLDSPSVPKAEVRAAGGAFK